MEGESQGGAGGVALQAERAAGENQEQQQVEDPAGPRFHRASTAAALGPGKTQAVLTSRTNTFCSFLLFLRQK